MVQCQVCRTHDRPAERIAHEILKWIAKKENYWLVTHTEPNSARDKQGKDFFVVPQKGGKALPIQIKVFRKLDQKTLQEKRSRIKSGKQKIKLKTKERKNILHVNFIKKYIRTLLYHFRRSNLLKNDSCIWEEFNKHANSTNFFYRLNSAKNPETLLDLYEELEHYLDYFEKAVVHEEKYPKVRLFFVVNMTRDGIVDMRSFFQQKKQVKKLREQWSQLIKKALSAQAT